MIDPPTETEWVRACFAMEGVREYYKHIGATESAMQSLDLIERCLRYGADPNPEAVPIPVPRL